MTDLFFSAKIMDTARKFGMVVEFVKDKSVVLDKVKEKPSLVIFDLNCDAAEPLELIRAIKADPATRRVSTIGFVFAQNLPMILKRHATAPPSRS